MHRTCTHIRIHKYTHMYTHTMSLSLSLSLSLQIFIYIYIYIHESLSLSIYIYIYGERDTCVICHERLHIWTSTHSRTPPPGDAPARTHTHTHSAGRGKGPPKGPPQGSGHCHLTCGPFSLTWALRGAGTIFSGAEGGGGRPLRTMYLTCPLGRTQRAMEHRTGP